MFGLEKFGDGIGLHRIQRFYDAHGIDTAALARRSIVVTGSNGKGSTARFTQALLGARGLSAGCFTSPHLFSVRERFLIGERRIPQEAFERHAATVLAFNETLPDGDRLGAFEFLFLMAVMWFGEETPDVIVWEAGIGGRYDPVRTLRAGLVGLTSIELEHTQILGATEELIAYDKIDALRPGGVLAVSAEVPPALRERIATYCALGDKRAVFCGDHFEVGDVANRADGVAFTLTPAGATSNATADASGEPIAMRLALAGRHQIDNALTALALARIYRGDDPSAPPSREETDALAAMKWPGRLEHVASDPDLWIDVGHTPLAVDLVTRAYLEFAPRERTLVVFGVSATKDVAKIAELVAARFDRFILTCAFKSGAPVESFAQVFAGKDVTLAADTIEAARIAKARAAGEGLSVLALGGLFLAVETEHAWLGGDPRELDFL